MLDDEWYREDRVILNENRSVVAVASDEEWAERIVRDHNDSLPQDK
jgi:hypothetical protein